MKMERVGGVQFQKVSIKVWCLCKRNNLKKAQSQSSGVTLVDVKCWKKKKN